MQYGLELAAAGSAGDPRTMATFAALAEATGWDGIFLEDYIVYWLEGVPTFDPWVTLAAMACATTRIRIGTTVTPLPRRRPWKLAQEAVTLDHLSQGRVTLGVGLGNGDDMDFAGLGEEPDARVRAEMLDEGLAILAGMWSGMPFSFAGTHYRMREQAYSPTPVQSPRIPIWIGGSSLRKGPVSRAARWDGMVPVPVSLPDGEGRHLRPGEVRDLRAAIAGQRTTDDPFDIALGGMARGGDWEAERAHIASVAAAGATWWLEWVPVSDERSMREAIERGPLRFEATPG